MLKRGKYGIEYITQPEDPNVHGVRWVVVIVVVAAFISLSVTLIRAHLRKLDERKTVEAPVAVRTEASTSQSPKRDQILPPPAEPPKPPPEAVKPTSVNKRPVQVRNLLMRLESAEAKRDLEMAVTTIEQLRALPGSPAADLDDDLARRLGTLNMRWLFQKKNAQWVREYTIRPGDNPSRIAAQHGSSRASLERLNGGNLDRIVAGKKLYVLANPRFQLTVHCRSRIADLYLNGRFFKRYDIAAIAGSKEGTYEVAYPFRQFWNDVGVSFKEADRQELECLLPKNAPVLVSEL